MGIPSYFHFLLKNHKRILTQKNQICCDDLCIDANSLIYDSVHELKVIEDTKLIYEKVKKKIYELIRINKPTQKTYVCFDGVPPFPKMVQQRQRRFKSVLTKQILKDTSNTWNTNHITPGTDFMIGLDTYLQNAFKQERMIIFSGTDEKGEGEHKICKLLRQNHNSRNIVIYGLDADLIMLGLLLHGEGFNIYLYKETKHFEYISQVNPDTHYYFEINVLGEEIHSLLEGSTKEQCICDYIFLCFLCGNDFMPHIPAIHIRNDGIVLLIEKYRVLKRPLIDMNKKQIMWSSFHAFIHLFKEEEEDYIAQNIMWKLKRKRFIKTTNEEERLNALPCMDTEKETYLLNNMTSYNTYILHQHDVEEVCLSYLKLLEWTWYYYNGIEKNDYIYYTYPYGPRFVDLLQYTPIFDSHSFLDSNTGFEDTDVYSQLFFVLPHVNHKEIIPCNIYDKCVNILYDEMPELLQMNFSFEYFLCNYFWESHLHMGDFNMKKLDKIIKQINYT